MPLTYAEENYLKALMKLSGAQHQQVSTNAIAHHLSTAPASVTDMLKKLADKHLITYQRYQGASLTEEGNRIATDLIRKHRLWEVFLVQSLGMTWDKVHEIAEELEHIQSAELIQRLDAFLGHPKFDPHGDPIPNALGKYTLRNQMPLTDLAPEASATIVGVTDDENAFLQHLSAKGIHLGLNITIESMDGYDQSVILRTDNQHIHISAAVANAILVKPVL